MTVVLRTAGSPTIAHRTIVQLGNLVLRRARHVRRTRGRITSRVRSPSRARKACLVRRNRSMNRLRDQPRSAVKALRLPRSDMRVHQLHRSGMRTHRQPSDTRIPHGSPITRTGDGKGGREPFDGRRRNQRRPLFLFLNYAGTERAPVRWSEAPRALLLAIITRISFWDGCPEPEVEFILRRCSRLRAGLRPAGPIPGRLFPHERFSAADFGMPFIFCKRVWFARSSLEHSQLVALVRV